jgi:hypothetical protein
MKQVAGQNHWFLSIRVFPFSLEVVEWGEPYQSTRGKRHPSSYYQRIVW